MAPLARFAQLEHGAPSDHLASVAEKRVENLLQVELARLAIDQRHHVDAEAVLHRRFFVQIVQDDLRHFAALELDHDPHA